MKHAKFDICIALYNSLNTTYLIFFKFHFVWEQNNIWNSDRNYNGKIKRNIEMIIEFLQLEHWSYKSYDNNNIEIICDNNYIS